MTVSRRAFMMASLMIAAAGMSYALKPRTLAMTPEMQPRLDSLVPARFGQWVLDTSVTPVLPDEGVQAKLRKLYDQTLARSYVNPQGQRIMLVIAYGVRQTDSLRAHQPEICYTAQGFDVGRLASIEVEGAFGSVRAHRLIAIRGTRVEPVVYWLSVGGKVTDFGLSQKLEQVRAGLRGRIPEGFLVRASLIGPAEQRSYARLDQFLSGLLTALPSAERRRMAGV